MKRQFEIQIISWVWREGAGDHRISLVWERLDKGRNPNSWSLQCNRCTVSPCGRVRYVRDGLLKNAGPHVIVCDTLVFHPAISTAKHIVGYARQERRKMISPPRETKKSKPKREPKRAKKETTPAKSSVQFQCVRVFRFDD